jgi:hypothetical protein
VERCREASRVQIGVATPPEAGDGCCRNIRKAIERSDIHGVLVATSSPRVLGAHIPNGHPDLTKCVGTGMRLLQFVAEPSIVIVQKGLELILGVAHRACR